MGNPGNHTMKSSGRKHPTNSHAVPIVNVSEKITLTSYRKTYKFRRTQFPTVLAYAITSHSAQGITKDRVIINYDSNQAKHTFFFVHIAEQKH